MLRDPNLVPYSHQHQHALALCVRIQQGMNSGSPTLIAYCAGIQAAFEEEIQLHFEAEEMFLFPAAEAHPVLRRLVSELTAEHTTLRAYYLAAVARAMSKSDLLDFAATLSDHIRKEERLLFEECQRIMSEDELSRIGQETLEFMNRKQQQ